MARIISALFLVMCLANVAGAAEPQRDILVTPEWLAERLDDPSLVVVQVADIRLDYLREHIPGARFLWPGWLEQTTAEMTVELFPVATMDSVLESLGISNSSEIVLCDTYSLGTAAGAARAWATLDYLGMGDRAKILDGGFQAWQAAGKPTTKEVPKVARGSFTPKIKEHVFVDLEYVKSRVGKPGIRLVDVRRSADYHGDPKIVLPSGHIPGAVSLPFASVIDESRCYAPIDTLGARFAAAGIQPGDEIIAYCYRGKSACFAYVAATMLGYKAHVYDGSFEEWWGRGDLPLEMAPVGE